MDRRYPGTYLSGSNPLYTILATANEVIEYIPEQQIIVSKGVLVQNP